MRTMYRYYFDTIGETFFENKEIRKQFELKVEPAQVLWSSKKILKANMLQFCWFEYFGGKAEYWDVFILKKPEKYICN